MTITRQILWRKLKTPKGLWVWVPLVFTALLFAVVSDAQRGIKFHLGRRLYKPFLYNVGERLGYGGAFVVGGAAVGGGVFIFLRRVKEQILLEDEMWNPEEDADS